MKPGKHIFLICFILLVACSSVSAQNTGANLGFELGNFTNWSAYTWRYSVEFPQINTNPVTGFVSRRQAIMSDTSAYDANTGYALRKIPKGHKFSARLGDQTSNSDPNPRGYEQSLRYTMKIDSTNSLLVFQFALVLQYASDHTQPTEPRFRLTLYDSKGNDLKDCSDYDVFASNKTVKGFQTYTPTGQQGPGVSPVIWRDWTSVGADLHKYMGQTITIEFMTADCAHRFHYGYAYFVAECHPMYIITKYCASDTVAILKAPQGFESYQWKDSNGTIVDTSQNHVVEVPQEKQSFSCQMTSATGCVVSLNTSIQKYNLRAEFGSFMLDCFKNAVQLTNQSATNHGSLTYEWNFGDGSTSNIKSPVDTFKTSGLHTVSLVVKNPPSECTDTITKTVESFSPPLVGLSGDTTYCPGLGTFIKAHGAAIYDWNTSSHADSIEVSAPGGKFWLVGHSTTGCISDTSYITITPEPDWVFTQSNDTIICGNSSISLSASGAESYLWTPGDTSNTIVVTKSGSYSVTGANKRGCKKTISFKVSAYPLPETDFTFSPSALDRKHYNLSLKSAGLSTINYDWNLGDGSYETGGALSHSYNIIDSVLYYKISLLATSLHGCTDSISKYLEVVPFVPNVFTPNSDEINDIFMPGFSIEIVDRNGMLLYNGTKGWDGRYNGKPADPDTYFYNLIYLDSKERVHNRRGYVILIR